MRSPASSRGGGREGERPARGELSRRAAGAGPLGRGPRTAVASTPRRSISWPSASMVRVGVLADVERGQVQAEAASVRIARSSRPWAISSPRCCDQGRAHQFELGQQIARRPRSRAPARAAGRSQAGARVLRELLLDAGELQAVGLLRVQPQEARRHLGEQLQVACQAGAATPASRPRSGWTTDRSRRSTSTTAIASRRP